ncbi:HTH domain-containing protein [Priestia megaterium]|uniref:HTH domain-containing protein n=1 Tax=Priestia megaterium TaxID=1404 RepID=UPI002E24A999|nr:HTH domain-containing protein [Priestia megaterium]
MMLVKKMLNAIMLKEITIKELADQYDVSTRTIQLKIKKLSYQFLLIIISASCFGGSC